MYISIYIYIYIYICIYVYIYIYIYIYIHTHTGIYIHYKYTPILARVATFTVRSVFKKSCLFLRPRPWQFEI